MFPYKRTGKDFKMKHVALTIAVPLALLLVLAGPATLAEGDVESGEIVFKKCKFCHTLIEGPKKIGPHLRNIVGRQAGTVPAFRYSKAMTASDVVWTAGNLDRFLENPGKFIRKNQMTFTGIRSAKLRRDIIAYLREATTK